jgi:thiol-disulfide isomerase/thioredoxin
MKLSFHRSALFPCLLRSFFLCLFPVLAAAQLSDQQPTIRFVRNPDPAPEFTLASIDGKPVTLAGARGKVILLNFWATWCGPCHELEPSFSRVAAEFLANSDVLFLAANCDEDESLVKSYLEADKFSMPVVFADGLDRFFTVNAFPTVMVIDRTGKIAYRSDGFQPDSFEPNLAAAVRLALAPISTASPPAKRAP